MKAFAGSFILAAGLGYGGLSWIGQDKILKMVMNKGKYEELPMSREWTKTYDQYKQFDHPWRDYLIQSAIHHNAQDSATSYLYFPKGASQGFPGVCHGGFSYSLCLLVAQEHAKTFQLVWPPKHTKMTYKAPIKTEGHYQIRVVHEAPKTKDAPTTVKAEIVDHSGKVYSTFTGNLQ